TTGWRRRTRWSARKTSCRCRRSPRALPAVRFSCACSSTKLLAHRMASPTLLRTQCPRCGKAVTAIDAQCPSCGHALITPVLLQVPLEKTHLRPDANLLEGKWRLEQMIGEGGMGQVWRARDIGLDRTVAVKFLSEDFAADSEPALRFEREAKVMA